MGDLNVHNTAWNCQRTDVNGDRLMEEMARVGLYVLNEDTKTQGEAGWQDSNLDLIITNDTIYNCIEYRQLNDTWGSDHFPLTMDIGIKSGVYSKKK